MIKDRKKPEKHLRICVKCAKIDSGLAENLLQDYNKARAIPHKECLATLHGIAQGIFPQDGVETHETGMLEMADAGRNYGSAGRCCGAAALAGNTARFRKGTFRPTPAAGCRNGGN